MYHMLSKEKSLPFCWGKHILWENRLIEKNNCVIVKIDKKLFDLIFFMSNNNNTSYGKR